MSDAAALLADLHQAVWKRRGLPEHWSASTLPGVQEGRELRSGSSGGLGGLLETRSVGRTPPRIRHIEERARQPREDHRYVDGERVDPEHQRLEEAQVLDPRTAQLFFGAVAPAGYSNTPAFASCANSAAPIPRSSRSTCSVCSPSRGAGD